MAKAEITVKVLDTIIEASNKLKQLNYELSETLTGEDCYFCNMTKEQILSSSYKSLLENSAIVRTFTTSTTGVTQTFLVFKDKKFDKNGNVIGENKISTLVFNRENLIKILEALQFNCWLDLKQSNGFYKLNDKTIILGMVENLGNFIEIEEYNSISTLNSNEKIDALILDAKNLGIKLGTNFFEKKADLLYQKKKAE